jgi:heme o synthase
MAVGSRPLVPSRLAPGVVLHRSHDSRRTPTSVVGAYIALTKPRIIELLLVTTVPTMVLADGGWPPLGLMLITLVGGTLSAGGANAINMYVDRDIDALMARTRERPLVTGIIEPRNALVFALVLEVVAFVVLAAGANLLAAGLAVGAAAFYVLVYTIWLKRTSRHNIVIGGAAGAAPVLVGWAAVTGSLDWTPVVLFLAMFLWTPPHFWALAIRYADDYRAADVPMLPAVAPAAERLHGGAGGHHLGAGAGGRAGVDLHRRGGAPRPRVPHRDDRPGPEADAEDEHEGVHVQHHLRDAAVRRPDDRRARPGVTSGRHFGLGRLRPIMSRRGASSVRRP